MTLFISIFTDFWSLIVNPAGDVLSGNESDGTVHLGVLQEWFGVHWWNSRAFSLLLVVLLVLLPLLLLRRIGQCLTFVMVETEMQPSCDNGILLCNSFFYGLEVKVVCETCLQPYSAVINRLCSCIVVDTNLWLILSYWLKLNTFFSIMSSDLM